MRPTLRFLSLGWAVSYVAAGIQRLTVPFCSSCTANLLTNALSSLTSKLAHLEHENASSAARVAELEARLRAAQHTQNHAKDRTGEDERRKVRLEVEGLLREERERREGAFCASRATSFNESHR